MDSVVPKGYKNTKVGVIPEEWEVVKIGEIITLLTDYHANGAYEKLKENVELLSYEDYAIMIRTTNFEKNNFTDNLIYVREEAYNYLKKSKVFENDIIINKIANAGATYFMPKIDKPVSLAMNLFLLRLNNEVNKKFIYIQIKQRENYLKVLSSGTTTKTITKNDVRSFQIPLPPLKEQQKIAKILTTWDDAISKQEELIKAKEQLKKGLMQKLLSGEVRFDGFSGEWEEVRLNQVGIISTGTTPSTKNEEYYKNGKYPWITPTDITENKNIFTSHKLLSEKGLKTGRFIQKDSILITCIASIGKNAILRVNGSCNQQINAIKVNDSFNTDFLYYLLEYNKNYLIKYAGQGGMMILNKNDFSNLKFNFPSPHEQQKIAEVLSNSDEEIDLLKNELQELKEQKKGLIQKLLTGIVRVKI